MSQNQVELTAEPIDFVDLDYTCPRRWGRCASRFRRLGASLGSRFSVPLQSDGLTRGAGLAHEIGYRGDNIVDRVELLGTGQQGPGHEQRPGFRGPAPVPILDPLEVDIVGEAEDASDHFAGAEPQ